jgi:antitoxin component YwqK of YwqJK toxin-antitoxin module
MALPYMYVQNLNASTYSGYFPDSTIQYEVELKNGFKDGAFTEYYQNGEVKMKGHFKSGKRDGAWRLYDESGKLTLRRTYDNDVITKEKSKDD